MNYKYKNMDIVYVEADTFKGKALIRGVAATYQPVIDNTYIIEPLDFTVKSDTYKYDMCVCFEFQIKNKL